MPITLPTSKMGTEPFMRNVAKSGGRKLNSNNAGMVGT